MAVIFCLLPLLESEIKYYTTYKITYLLRNLTTNTTIPTYMLQLLDIGIDNVKGIYHPINNIRYIKEDNINVCIEYCIAGNRVKSTVFDIFSMFFYYTIYVRGFATKIYIQYTYNNASIYILEVSSIRIYCQIYVPTNNSLLLLIFYSLFANWRWKIRQRPACRKKNCSL